MSLGYTITLVLLCGILSCSLAQPDGALTVAQRCERYGFGYEEYQITTEDGYINTLMRIPSTPGSQQAAGKPPLYFIHATPFSSEDFTARGPEDSPAFHFANLGYDVWLNNWRGSIHSRDHVQYDPQTDHEYWNYDLVDMRYDLLADIMFILNTTEYDRLSTYAFSMGGTTLAYAMAIETEFFASRIGVAALMATPISYAHTNNFNYAIAGNYPWILTLFGGNSGIYHGPGGLLDFVQRNICAPFPTLCMILGGQDPNSDDLEGFSNLMMQGGRGESTRMTTHFVQSARTGRVSYFDYGAQGNLEVYGTEEAPLIPLQNTDNPVALLYSEEDPGSNPIDIEQYIDLLGDNCVFYQYYDVTHTGFLVSENFPFYPDLEELYETFRGEITV
ncbi:unnamed protein product [Moneuplotes crassus]|uniref:Partial AB-hydrolase lipase domain-containing protein n=1 Tax=Euplotes crassus TaxID=5936 RepID=A0AAD1XDN3_EUPCR|nr:unnamed protein product [Moneuplotes crassus]